MGKVFHIGRDTDNDEASWIMPYYKELVIEYVDPASKQDGKTGEETLFSNRGWEYARGLAWESPDMPDDAYADGRLGRAIRTDRYRLVEWKETGQSSDSAAFELYDYQGRIDRTA